MHALKHFLAVASVAMAMTAPAQALAQQPRCTINIDAITFGTYDPFSGADTASVGRLRVECTTLLRGRLQRTPLRVLLTPGLSGDQLRRTMTSGANTLAYNIFIDETHTRIAGDGAGGASLLQAAPSPPGANGLVTYNLYGVIQARQLPPKGTYTDLLQIVIEF